MRSRQISGRHEELIDNLATGEDKRPFEKLDPFFFCERMVAVEPIAKRAALFLQFKDFLCIDDGSIDLETITNDSWIVEQTREIFFTVPGYFGNVEIVIRLTKVICFFQNGDPGKPGLIDFEDKALEEQVVIVERKPILGIVIVFVMGVFRVGIAIVAVSSHKGILPV
jgi:hypothetical protein